jgi:PAS domain-containing protein
MDHPRGDRALSAQLGHARDRYADLYEFAPIGYLSVGPDGVIREANLTAAKLLARERASLIGKRLSHFVARRSQDVLFLRWREALQSRVRTTCELRMSRPDVPDLDVELDIVAHPVDSTTDDPSRIAEVRVMLSDITERRLAEQRLAADLDAIKLLQKLSNRFVRGDKLETLLGEIVETAIACAGADFGSIQLLDPTTGDLRIVAHRGFPSWWIDFWNEASKNQGCCGAALERGNRVIVEDVARDPIFVGTPALGILLRAGVRAVQSTPLVSRSGRLLAMLSTHYRTPHRPDERVLRLLDLSARQAADLIERAQAEATLRESEERWKFALQATDVGAWRLNLVDHTAWRSLRHDQIFGYDQLLPEWTYETFLEHVLEQDRARVDQSFQQVLTHRQDWDLWPRLAAGRRRPG